MFCLREFAKHYYDRFHNPQRLFTESGIGWVVTTFLSLFLVFTYFAFGQLFSSTKEVGFGVNIVLALILEVMWGGSHALATHFADNKNIDYVSRITGRKCSNISQARMFYLKGWLEKESLYVGETIKNINSSIAFVEDDGYFFSPRPTSLSELIFNKNAKPRVISLFIALCAIFLTLGVSNGAALDQIFAFYDTDLREILTIYAITIMLLVGVYLAANPIIALIYSFTRWLGSVFFSKDFGGVEVLSIFARDLMFYCSDSLYEHGGQVIKSQKK